MAARKKKNDEGLARKNDGELARKNDGELARKNDGEMGDQVVKSRTFVSKNEFQLRKQQLEDIQARALEVGDLRAELDAVKELNKLCGLYSEPVENGESAAVEIARIHLEGTGVVEKGLPLEELARRIAIVVATNIDALKNAYD